MIESRERRLCFGLAFCGVILMYCAAYGFLWQERRANFDLPRFEKASPALSDWPVRGQWDPTV